MRWPTPPPLNGYRKRRPLLPLTLGRSRRGFSASGRRNDNEAAHNSLFFFCAVLIAPDSWGLGDLYGTSRFPFSVGSRRETGKASSDKM